VAQHRRARPSSWRTVEAPLDLLSALGATEYYACVLLDCASVWVSNHLLSLGEDPALDEVLELEAALEHEVRVLLELQERRQGDLIVVTNEVGSGVVPPSALGRAYRDLLGRVNQAFSAGASRAWLMASGRALELPPPES
jgi:adenosyl cobinamide kinase/adenosyl cobinamide phosphate guanylyltransferase